MPKRLLEKEAIMFISSWKDFFYSWSPLLLFSAQNWRRIGPLTAVGYCHMWEGEPTSPFFVLTLPQVMLLVRAMSMVVSCLLSGLGNKTQ